MIVLERPDLTIRIELKTEPTHPETYIQVYIKGIGAPIRLTSREAFALSETLHIAANSRRDL